ncbi:MAG: dinitrogenase iron-molybdenum cofactor biosynthesis protein [Candidatus Thorarchaeota archaeon]|nr:MAG: dinitrogenase iron-molybdenum cofactor biosynthesis protein [Candidatus Thorarchaeota archaeon]
MREKVTNRMSIERVAVTADSDNGLDSPMSGHFGHCRAFVVSTIKDGEIIDVETIPNLEHTSCGQPVEMLINRGVNVLITQGMGMRPFIVAQQSGLSVLKGSGGSVREVVLQYVEGKIQNMSDDGLCQGGGAHRQ